MRASGNVKSWVRWGLIRVCDTCGCGDDSSAGLGIETLDITTLTDLKRGADVALVEFESSLLVNLLSEVSVRGVWADEGDKDDLTGEAEELGDLGDTTDVLGTVLLREAKVLVKTSSNDISIEEEDFLVVLDKSVNLSLERAGQRVMQRALKVRGLGEGERKV